MKKVLAGILVATTVLGLVGCGNSGTKDSSKDNADKKEIVIWIISIRAMTVIL